MVIRILGIISMLICMTVLLHRSKPRKNIVEIELSDEDLTFLVAMSSVSHESPSEHMADLLKIERAEAYCGL